MRNYTLKPDSTRQRRVDRFALLERNRHGRHRQAIDLTAACNTCTDRRPGAGADTHENAPAADAGSRFGFEFCRVPLYAGNLVIMQPDDRAGTRPAKGMLRRSAAGPGPAFAPPIVHEVLRGIGRPLPTGVRNAMETLLDQHLDDVRVHTGEREGDSADAVNAHAYTVGRHIVFASGRFEPGSARGRRLLAHELAHAATHPPGAPTPSGVLRISAPDEAAERHAAAVAEGAATQATTRATTPATTPAATPATSSGLYRAPAGLVALTGVRVNHDRVTVPPVARLSFKATKQPANASGVTFALVGDNASIVAGTAIDVNKGKITVASGQTGGSAHVEASQNATGPGGVTLTSSSPATAPFVFTAIPSGISSTSASVSGNAGSYGGEFTHTFTSPGGGQTALELAHVNEQFPGASGTRLTIKSTMGSLTITVNKAGSASAGWDLDASGTMTGPDHVTWSHKLDARPFITNASNPAPKNVLPQELTATQNFRNLNFPPKTYGTAAVASTTHRRAFEERKKLIKAVTSANATGIKQEVVEDYEGPTVFRRCSASPASIPVASAGPDGGPATAASTSTISVDAEGQAATPVFSIRKPDLGCTISAGGELTPGTTRGTVTVRAGDRKNFDETTVTLT